MVSRARAARSTQAFVNNGRSGDSMSPAAAAAFASLQQQVLGLEGDFTQQMARVEAALESLNRKIDDSRVTPWPTYISGAGLLIAFMTTIGYMAYRPIDSAMTAIAQELKEQRVMVVPRTEHQREWDRRDRDLADLRGRTERNQADLVPRELYSQSVTALQRQIDEVRKDIGGVVTTRDVLQGLEKKIERLEQARQ